MHNSLILLFTLFLSLNSFGQSGKSLVIAVGPSFPMGDFSKNTGAGAGLANIGGFLDLSYNFPVGKTMTGIGLLKGKINGVDLSGFKGPAGTGAATTIKSGVYNFLALMGGLSYALPLDASNRNALQLRTLIGAQRTGNPSFKGTMTVPNIGVYKIDEKSKAATAFAYLLGAAFQRNLNSKMAFKISADFSASKPSYKVNEDPSRSLEPSDQEGTVIIKQNIAAIDIGAGLLIKLK